MKKNLPISISTFQEILSRNCVYVDKTRYAYELFKFYGGLKYVFLSRPRRFGKSLFLDTLKEIFLGKKEMFRGLWIYDSDWDWQEHPVIHIDFSTFDKRSVEDFEEHILSFLNLYGERHSIDLSGYSGIHGKFDLLIRELSRVNKVVLLIDEYDKPILDNIHDVESAIKMRDLLKSFYEVIKGNDASLRALFMTGVTKFGQMSVFSGLNNLYDISLEDKYAAIVGYTQEDLEAYFDEYLVNSSMILDLPKSDLLLEIKDWYNGYRFTNLDLAVYNPFSVINFFGSSMFKNYWFSTGTPTFLIKLLKKEYIDFEELSRGGYSLDIFNTFDLEDLPIIPILYQSGYLTITSYDQVRRRYTLGYPNYEIAESFNKVVIEALSSARARQITPFSDKLYDSLVECDFESFFNLIQTFISTIPSELLIHKEIYYNAIFHCILNLVANQVYSQQSHFKRRSDTVVIIDNNIYIFELKLNKTPKDALDQIQNKRYYEPHLNSFDNIYLIGVNFATDNLFEVNYIVEKLKK